MRLAKLFWRLLRYRVAVMLILFMLLAAAIHGGVADHAWQLVVGACALALSYVSATSSNDLADQKIDAINHPNSAGRPLITGSAKRIDMWLMFSIASVIAVLLVLAVNIRAGLIMTISIILNVIYSLPPARFSYRTFLAPLTLGVAYVGVPYFLALALINADFTSSDVIWIAGFYFLFIGRIVLKDFRDRKGDAKYHKPTFLLRFGKTAVCVLSLVCLITGAGSLMFAVSSSWLALALLAYVLPIAWMLRRLFHSDQGEDEQISIGVGARLGNGLLITLLAVELLKSVNATDLAQVIVVILLSAVYLASYVTFLRNPESALVGYKG